jgi:IclR family transcriptional regulator, KDG regulon repressor
MPWMSSMAAKAKGGAAAPSPGPASSSALDLREDDGVALFPYSIRQKAEEDFLASPASKKEPREYSAPAVDRTLDILEFMAKHPKPYGATELSRELKVPVNSIFRILKRLTEREYTTQDPATGGYQLSTRVFSLGMSLYTRYELRHRARPHLEWLCRETQETCQISIPREDKLLVLDTVSPEVEFYLRVVPGSLVYYHPSAFGKAILAFENEEEVQRILPARLPGLTPKTIQLRAELLKSFDLIRRTGLAYDDEEYTTGILCIGAPVFDVTDKAVAGLGITGLLGTYGSGKKPIFERLVLECAARVSRDIGYTGNYFDDKGPVSPGDEEPDAY